MTIVCAAKHCKYSSKSVDSSQIVFINFPNDDASKLWAHHCGRTDLLMKSNEEIHLNYYICSHHIEDRYYISKNDPIIIEGNAVPTIFEGNIEKEGRNTSTRTKMNGNVSIPSLNMDIVVDKWHGTNDRFSNLCRICGEPSNNALDIFNEKHTKPKLKDKIKMYLPIVVDLEDSMPHRLCENCNDKLEMIHALTVICLKTDMRFKKSLNIPGVPEYDKKYSEIVKQCSLDLAEEVCTEEPVETAQLHLSEQTMATIWIDSEEATSNEAQSSIINLLHCYSKVDKVKKSKSLLKVSNIATNSQEDQVISCMHCQDTFKSQKSFEKHKTLCQGKTEGDPDQYNLNSNKDDSNTDCNTEINKSVKCGHCDAVYPTRKELYNHTSECHNGRVLFKCFTCNKSYETWAGFDVHEATHSMDTPYLCDICGKSFKHSNNLRGHKRTHLDDARKKRHVCKTCGKKFRSGFYLREHTNQHEDRKPYSCELCGKTFHKGSQLRQHKFTHGLNKYPCPMCDASFNRKGNMVVHLRRHANPDEMYECSVCTAKYKTMRVLLQHRKIHTRQEIIDSIRRSRSDKAVWECDVCDTVFPKRALLIYHQHKHAGISRNTGKRKPKVSYKCDECDKKLASKTSLSYHKNCFHSTEKRHACQHCSETFLYKEELRNHEHIHTGDRPYLCDVCNKRYKCSSNLHQHMKIHTGLKPHKCSYCDKSFTRRDTLTVHERIHTGIKPYPCKTCGKRFKQSTELRTHSRTHRWQEIRCEICNKVFTSREEMQKHIAWHEENKSVANEHPVIPTQISSS